MSIYIDLVLDTSDIVRIECPNKHEDELWESLDNAMKQRCTWSPQQFEGCSAKLNGLLLGRVQMARVVGML